MALDLFFELIRVALGSQDGLSRQLQAYEWDELFDLARKQSLVGICFVALQRLSATTEEGYIRIGMRKGTYLTWMAKASCICVQNQLQSEQLLRVSQFLENKGHRTIFMKGLVCGSRYPDPLFRQCGDIDFVVKREEFKDVMKELEEVAQVDHDLIHEHHGMARIDDVTLEPHFKIHNFQNPLNDRMMAGFQRKLLERKERRFMALGAEERVAEVFPMEFEGMHMVSHMVNHVYEEGLGLRQVMDFAFWIKKIKDSGEQLFRSATSVQVRREVREFNFELYHYYLERMHMTRAARIFTCICERLFSIDHSIMNYVYSEKELTFADYMLKDIMAVGNFAKEAEGDHSAGWASYRWVVSRCWRLGYLCPSEAWFWPLCKLVRFGKKSIRKKMK